jgi:hypothetical protein
VQVRRTCAAHLLVPRSRSAQGAPAPPAKRRGAFISISATIAKPKMAAVRFAYRTRLR